jgi:sRNA-binding carbon storage regulator CsrA
VNIVVLEVQGTRVRLGFDAPLEEPVYRAELWNRKLEAELRGSCDEILVEA